MPNQLDDEVVKIARSLKALARRVRRIDATNVRGVIAPVPGGGAPNDASYVVMGLNAVLTDERALIGTINQVAVADGGAGGAVTLSTPQNIHTGATPTFAGMNLAGTLAFTGAQSITTTASDLTLAPAGDIILDPQGDQVKFTWVAGKSLESSDYVSGLHGTGWGISYGTTGGHADFRSICADELHVAAFIADIYSALAGALIITKSRARMSRDFTIPNTGVGATLYVEDHEGFEGFGVYDDGDYVLLRIIDTSGGGLIVTDVYGSVNNYTDLS
ncbi:hypothetical protein LCGC14_1803180, partial [marine sediment metagenome]